ncbi:MAG TPA: ATP-grasp domain-containing protein [Gammaproteobacteria bacterium]
MRRLRRGGRYRRRLRLIPADQQVFSSTPVTGERDPRRPFGRRVLLIAPPTSYRISAYFQAALRLGIDLVVASAGRHSLIPEIASGISIDLDAPQSAIEVLTAAARRAPFHAVIATDDATVELASQVATRLGLPHNSPHAARIARRKDLAREALASAGLPVPDFRRIDLTNDPESQIRGLGFPLVLKPLALSGSRGVIRVDDPVQLADACRRIAPLIRDAKNDEERRFILAERFLPGEEFAVEGMLVNGELELLAIFDKPEPLNGPYFEETYYLTPSRSGDKVQAAIARRVEEACRAYGLEQGPVHAELRLVNGEPYMLEIAARTIGGDCARLLSFGSGAGLEDIVLGHAVGAPVKAVPASGAAGVLMIPVPGAGVLRRVEGVLAARRVPAVEDVVIAIREGYELVPLPEGGSYLGFIFASAKTPAEVETALRAAHACLKFVLAPVWRLEPAPARNA